MRRPMIVADTFFQNDTRKSIMNSLPNKSSWQIGQTNYHNAPMLVRYAKNAHKPCFNGR